MELHPCFEILVEVICCAMKLDGLVGEKEGCSVYKYELSRSLLRLPIPQILSLTEVFGLPNQINNNT